MSNIQDEGRRMRDEKIVDDIRYCARCGISFLWSSEEQRSEVDATPPHHCAGCRHLLPAASRERGMVKWYNHRKRYGFLTRRHAPELFFHQSALAVGLRVQPGDLVEFAVDEGDKGLQAVAIQAATIHSVPEIRPVSTENTTNATDEAPEDAGPPN
jgi:CspA family cold shock protein